MEKEKTKKIIKYIIITILVIGAILLYAHFIGTKSLFIKEYPIKTSYLKEEYDGFKIVQFSDLHYGSTVGIEEVKNLVKKINNLKPDVIVFTGDLIDQDYSLSEKDKKNLVKELKKLEPLIEIISIKGNHDYKSDAYDEIVTELNWHNLDNTYEYVYSKTDTPIVFVGLDDLLKGKPDYDNAFSYLNETAEELYTIVLAHEPDQIDEFKDYNFNLCLSGHSHLGQIRVPFIGAIYTPKGSKKYYDEHYKVDESDLYISGGIGTSVIDMRLFNRPSINLYRFYTK